MSDISGGAPKFPNRDELEAWLKTQPREVSVVIAARAALRVLPTLHLAAGIMAPQQFAELSFATFWTAALARVAAKNPTSANELPAEAAAAATAGYDHIAACRSSALAARAASANLAASYSSQAVGLAANSAAVAADAADDVWQAVSADANWLNGGTKSPSDLACEELWLDRAPPDWIVEHFAKLQHALDPANWQVWFDWYSRRINGRQEEEEEEEIELLFATLPTDPREKGPAEQNKELAAAIEKLRERQLPSDNAGFAQAVERIVHDPHGASVSIVEGQARIVGSASEGDLDAAQNPQTRQLHERVKKRAAAALTQAKRLHNQGGFGNIAETIDEFAKWIDGDTEAVAQNISTVWELTVAIGTFIDRDDKAGLAPDDMTPKMDLAAREAVDQLIVAAAPFVRRFPTAYVNDEEYRKFRQSKEQLAPSLRIVVAGKEANTIEQHTGDVLQIALEASEREGPQAEKSRLWSLATVKKAVAAMCVSVMVMGSAFSTGAMNKAGEKYAEKSQAVGRMVDYLLHIEDDFMKSLEDHPADLRAVMREFFRRLRAENTPPPDPPRSI